MTGARPKLYVSVQADEGWGKLLHGNVYQGVETVLDAAKAVAVFQLTYADLDLTQYPPQPPGSILPLFASLGLVDTELRAKPALAEWDRALARRWRAR